MPEHTVILPNAMQAEPNTEGEINLHYKNDIDNVVTIRLNEVMLAKTITHLLNLAFTAPNDSKIKSVSQLVAIRNFQANFRPGLGLTMSYENEAGIHFETTFDIADATRLRDDLTRYIDMSPALKPMH